MERTFAPTGHASVSLRSNTWPTLVTSCASVPGNELDPGGQLARLHRHVDMVIFIARRIRSHASMVLEEESKSCATRCKLHQIR
jgi:hypothetical protein